MGLDEEDNNFYWQFITVFIGVVIFILICGAIAIAIGA